MTPQSRTGLPAMTSDVQAGFRALADPTRRDILVLLARRDMTIAEVAENFEMTRAAVKKHLTLLRSGGLITVRARGREKINSLDPAGMKPLVDWFGFFDLFWDERLSSLKETIEKDIQ